MVQIIVLPPGSRLAEPIPITGPSSSSEKKKKSTRKTNTVASNKSNTKKTKKKEPIAKSGTKNKKGLSVPPSSFPKRQSSSGTKGRKRGHSKQQLEDSATTFIYHESFESLNYIEGHDDEDDDQKEQQPYFSILLLVLWGIVGTIFIYQMIMTIVHYTQLLNIQKGESSISCCGDDIENVAIGGGILLPTILFTLLLGLYVLSIAFMIKATINPSSRLRIVPLVHVTYTVSPLFEAVLFWFFLPVLSTTEAIVTIVITSLKLLIQVVAMGLVLRRNLKHNWQALACCIIVQLHGLATIVALYFIVIKGKGGLCYIPGQNGFRLQGCELCSSSGVPPINGECPTGGDNDEEDDSDDLDQFTYCSSDNLSYQGGQSDFCWFEFW